MTWYSGSSHEIVIDLDNTFLATASNEFAIRGYFKVEAFQISDTVYLFIEKKLTKGYSIELQL